MEKQAQELTSFACFLPPTYKSRTLLAQGHISSTAVSIWEHFTGTALLVILTFHIQSEGEVP